MYWKTFLIADHELGLLYRDRTFVRILEAGKHKVYGRRSKIDVKTIDLRQMPIREGALKTLYALGVSGFADHFAVADMGDTEVGLVFADGKLADVVGPGQTAFYGAAFRDVRIDTIDVAERIEVPAALIAPLIRVKSAKLVTFARVPSDHVGLLYVDGVLQRTLEAGLFGFFTAVRIVKVVVLDRRLTTLEVTGQELLTRDRVGVRANVTAVYRITDPVQAVTVIADVRDFLYKALQFALREVIGTRTLEEVLGDKQGINAALTERLLPQLEGTGLSVSSIGVKDVILPGDVRDLMNRVIEAEKTAQANVIKRREETAATRSLLNTAKLMEDNPILLRLKELEALEKVSEKVGSVIVGNGMDGVLDDLVRIKPKAKPAN